MSIYDVLEKWGIKEYRKVDEQGIKEITLGASILATGGGGDPEIGLLWALNVLNEGKEIILVDPKYVPDDIIVTIAACLGSALVLTEKTPSGKELYWCYEKLFKYLGKKVEAIIPPEAGGVNTPVPMAVAGVMGIPVIDGDGMGRAFPELQMTSFYINEVSPSPTASANEKGYVTIADSKDALLAERIIRSSAMAYGGIAWIAGYSMTGLQVKKTAILNSVSMTWDLGKAIFRCRTEHSNPIKEVEKIAHGFECFSGKVVDINREFGAETTKGFSLGQITMEGIGQYKGSTAKIDFQNEWLNLIIDNEVKCMTPDLITILDPETGEPIRTDIVKYGYRGSIVVIPAHERMRSAKGIETFGPRYFGYDMDYIPVEKLIRK
ncbi:DUF917 domain-containing protein [Desulfosporosinus metallidurans]|uniref:DUF917 domain-containing protein n=1 Tax=Desulfosporosinus metallidurans TaxID=1888891 RepID=A0A1Q8QH08_9FIRM|nr:DUF917 domain-containing protein [Desulfosporosinus metallidurans]OLN26624.1 hypothetical protein DSOL_4906 [Desulfosporosinus metallidurans]